MLTVSDIILFSFSNILIYILINIVFNSVLQSSEGGSGQAIFGFKTPKRKDALVNAGEIFYTEVKLINKNPLRVIPWQIQIL